MYFANPWGLLGLAALPIIVAIHLFHRRFPPMRIAGLHLWGTESEVRAPGRRRERLPITASLLLELLAAALLSLLLAQPRIGEQQRVPHLVVVLDNSASMQARPADGPSFRNAAVAEIEDRIAQRDGDMRVTPILTGRRPVTLAGPGARWPEVQEELARWKPAAPRHDFAPAWDLAAQLAEETGELLFLTDHLPADDVAVPQTMEIVSLGRPLDNVAVTAARWTLDPAENTGRVFLRIANLGRRETQVTIRGTSPSPQAVRGGPRTVFERSLTLAAGSAGPMQLEVPGGLGRLNIGIGSRDDALPADNRVRLIEPQVRLVTIAVTLPEDHSAREPVQRVIRTLPGVQPGNPAEAHLVVGPADDGPTLRLGQWWLGIGPLDRSEAARESVKDLAGPFVLERRNPLLEGVQLDGVIWGGVQPVDRDLTPMISSGRMPLLARLEGVAGATAYLLNIDFARSNLADSPDWPILFHNLIDERRSDLPGLRRWNYRLNEEIRFRLPETGAAEEEAGPLRLVHRGRSRPLARSRIVELPPLESPGIYEIRDGDERLGRFAVNFQDADESRLAALGPGRREPTAAARTAGIAVDRFYTWLILLGIVSVLLAVLLDWKVLGGRSGR